MKLDVGLLWFDNDPKSDLAAKVLRAAAYFQRKYGQRPTLCYVHPSMLPDRESLTVESLTVRRIPIILPHHFWLGLNEENEEP